METEKKIAKAIKMSGDTVDEFTKLAEASGDNQGDFFKKLLLEYTKKELRENEAIPSSLRQNYETDMDRLGTAMEAIMSLFKNQMDNFTVAQQKTLEWEQRNVRAQEKKDAKITNLEIEKTETFNKWMEEKTSWDRERNNLIEENERDKRELQSCIEKYNERADRLGELNERIKLLDGKNKESEAKIKELEPLKKENERLSTELQRSAMEIERIKESMAFETDKRLFELRRELEAEFEQERKTIRKETMQEAKELYNK